MGKAIWDRPVGFNASLEEGRSAFYEGKAQDSHRYGESAGGKEWVRGWKSAQEFEARKEKDKKSG